MASINTLLDNITAGVMTDASLHAWAGIYYDTDVSVLENCDSRSDPGQNDCPLVVVTPDVKSTGLSDTVKGHIIQVSCIIYDETVETTLEGVVRFLAGRRVEEMRQIVLAAVRNSLPDWINITDIDTLYMPLDEYPLVSTCMVLTLTEEKLIGATPFE